MKHTKYLFMAFAILVALFAFQVTAQAEEREVPIGSMITAAQFDCDYGLLGIPAGMGILDPNLLVTINNGTVSRNVIIQFSTEAVVSQPGGRIDLKYSIDGGSCMVIGPLYFACDTEYNTRTAIGVIKLGAGVHTIVPCYFTWDPAAAVWYRCLTAEGRTK